MPSLLVGASIHLGHALAFLLNFPEQRLVKSKLLAVHFLLGSLAFLLMHLLLEELGVFDLDGFDLLLEPILLLLVVLFIARPEDSLLVGVRLGLGISSLLLLHLAHQKLAHLLLLFALPVR